jgi:hypothetical protein
MVRYIIFFILLIPFVGFSQNYTLSGVVKDSVSGELLPGASVYTVDRKNGTMTDFDGKYELSLPAGTYEIEVYFYGYNAFNKTVKITENQVLNFPISSSTEQLETIVLKGERSNENIQDTKVSTIELNIEEIKKLPALFGEVDIIKNIQLLPGVQVAGEGNSGLYVRGGGADQNLVLLDNATIYNPVHAVGIFSVFNSDILGSTELYKGGIPASYGGRLSSLLDIRTKTGSYEKLGGSAGIGLLASRLMLQGPIVKDKASFIIAARRTYFDVFLGASKDKTIRQTKLYFLDLNGKISYKLNAKNFFEVSGYYGKDVLKLGNLFTNDYGNNAITGQWKHIFSEKSYSQTFLTYSTLDFNIGIELNDEESFKINNGLSDLGLKHIINRDLNKNNTLTYGFDASYKTFFPGKIVPGGNTTLIQEFIIPNTYSVDGALFLSNKQKISNRLSVDYGLRYSVFSQIGAASVVNYKGIPDKNNITDTSVYKSTELIKPYSGLEPRASARYSLNEVSSIKASYNRMYQYLHLLSNTTSPVPGASWVPSSKYIEPERADQIAIGYFRNFKDNTYEASVEAYYKYMNNVIDFVDDAEVFMNETPETQVRAGISNALGSEFFLRKNKGKTTGWISYTLSKVTRQIDEINNGKSYIAGYDRRHNLNIVLTQQISKRVSLSGTFVYGTGRPFTLPSAKYQFDYTEPVYYTSRNGYRLRDYHRMDLAMNVDFNQEGKIKSSLNISLYNAYGRKNPYTVLVQEKNTETGIEKQLAMVYLFRWLPSITYNINF